MKRLVTLLSHLCVILSLSLITLYIVDLCNPTMEFINNSISKGFLLALCVCSLPLAVVTLARHRNR